MIDRSRRVVLLIDYDNLQICAARDTPGRDLQLQPVVQLAQHYGTVILARAYAEWNLSTERLAVYKAGIEPAFAPVLRTESDRSGKSLADTVMVAEGMDMLWTLSPDVVVLATSDKDLIPLVRVAKQRGAFVVVLGSDFTAIPLREMADEHVTYKQLVTDAQGRYVTEAGPARQPAALPEPVRRRTTRERNGRERTLTTSAPTGIPAAPQPARVEREQQPLGASSVPAVAPSTAEAVPPLSVGTSSDGEMQALGRRRRRRGSRRRSERLGGIGESLAGAEGGPEAEDSGPENDAEGEIVEGPFGAAPDEGSFAGPPDEGAFPGAREEGSFPGLPDEGSFPGARDEGSFATPREEGTYANAPEPDEPEELIAAVDAAPTTTAEPVHAVEPPPMEADVEGSVPPPPATRNRRRTARRPSAAVSSGTVASARGPEVPNSTAAAAPEGSVPPPPSPAQTADILWAAEPAAANGTQAAEDAESTVTNTEPVAEGGAVTTPTPRPRARRVASAARGRSRPTGGR